ncbi:MAG: cobyric acid synthase CobQ, partial [Deltaproteobacteria bacterium]|nr:cobyric acid synthase CobQ [Deltaproteobacteria bacterium]
KGLGLLDVETTLEKEKKTYQVAAIIQSEARSQESGVNGYEIHMGDTTGREKPFSIITERNSAALKREDGAISKGGRVWGTYIHGIFDNDEFRAGFLNEIRIVKGLPEQGISAFAEKKDKQMKTLAITINNSIDLPRLYEIMKIDFRPV